MNKNWTFTLCLLLLSWTSCDTIYAQESYQTTHATLFGVGGVRQLDTYLSPLSYQGPQVQFLYETLRPTHWGKGNISTQSIWQGNFAYTESPAGNANNIGADIRYNIGWHYNWLIGSSTSSQRLRIMLGAQLDANAGVLYNTRNGNNPAQAIASLGLSASAAAIYYFQVRRQPFFLREQLDVPLIGAKFSPNYGQSYYEIFSEGNSDHNICATTPFNAPSLRNLLTLDIPFRKATLRVGYLIDIKQSDLNQLKYHSYTHAFMIGWVRHIIYQKPQRQSLDGYIL